MDSKKFRYSFDELALTTEGIWDVIGYSEGDDRGYISALIDEILKECSTISDVRAEYLILDNISFEKKNRAILIGNTYFNVETIVFSQLRKSSSAALFLCTAGPETGRRSRKLMQDRDMLAGYIYDVIGSEMVEAAADLMQNELEESLDKQRLKITNRYSPGYCGWNVSEQHKLFSFFNDNHCGIRLLPSALMDPEKSVSGIIGIGKDVKLNPYTCRICDMEDCIYRRVREGRR